MTRTRTSVVFAVGLGLTLAARPAGAHTQNVTVEIPNHLVIDNQIFDATPAGFHLYLDSIRATNPGLYGQLAPDAERLEARVTAGRIILIAGFAAGVASTVYGFAGGKDCAMPSATDPNFAADAAAWDACNHDNFVHGVTFSLIGAGLAAAGLVGWAVAMPSRNELLDLVNRHNRASPQPMQLQLGYDPIQHLARAGALFTF
jgi:hypothetical protein